MDDAFAAMITEALAGGFRQPRRGGWSAERIVAHVARNQEELIGVAEAALRGETAEYGHEAATDPADLDRYVDRYGGGLRGLADRLAETVVALRTLCDGAGLQHLLRHEEDVHGPEHLAELLALRPSPKRSGRPGRAPSSDQP
ncbi:MAG: hypothetical protein J2P15_13315 [Micromonosporaceae bacterium]|nr:hypothetical protein [Micromonosporaceae bacterium]